ncbi:MAG: hypothetical protein AAGJ46_05745 [Planctomycetota bacterium]
MTAPSAKAIRCESCGATIAPGTTRCDYCGSHHQLPAYTGEPVVEAPATSAPLRLKRVAVLIGVAAIGALAAWALTR